MKKLASFLVFSLFICKSLDAQVFNTEEKAITGIFDAKEKNKAELFSSINKWISINYNSAKNVIQMNELESGTIIVKGINDISYRNPSKQLYPNNKFIPERYTVSFNHLVEFNIKDNKYRIIFTITGVTTEGYDNLFFNCINLDTLDNNAILLYNQSIENQLKAGLISKEKRDETLALSQPMFQDISATLRDDIKLIMFSVEKSVSASDDNW